ncbi:hypothetical protein [Campylobacter phage CJLB-7]|nr:hypothetical protein [Campylobacter phage CJLB-7]
MFFTFKASNNTFFKITKWSFKSMTILTFYF